MRAWREWAVKRRKPASTIDGGRYHLRAFHDFLITRKHTRDYFRPEERKDFVDWHDAKAFQDLLVSRVETGEIKRAAKNIWWSVVNFYQWRFEEEQSKRNRDDLENVKLFETFPMKFSTENEGEVPYNLEHLWKIVEASRSYATVRTGEFPATNTTTIANEDYEFVLVLVYLGQRAEIVGLLWDEVHFDLGMVNPKAKGAYTWELPLKTELANALRDLRARKPDARMVFTSGSFPWDDRIPLFEYYGRERDELYCDDHLARTCAAAQTANKSAVGYIMDRVEKALHRLYPDLTEIAFDARGKRHTRPVHLTSHRFRKTVATFYIELGLTKEEAAKITGWKDPETIRRKYWKPELAAKQKLADQVDVVKASMAADRGELESMRRKTDLEKLQDQVAKLTATTETRDAKLEEKDSLIARLQGQIADLTEIANKLLRERGAPLKVEKEKKDDEDETKGGASSAMRDLVMG
mgnify:FL=1